MSKLNVVCYHHFKNLIWSQNESLVCYLKDLSIGVIRNSVKLRHKSGMPNNIVVCFRQY